MRDQALSHDAGIRDDDVQTAEFGHGLGHRGIERVVVPDVDLARNDSSSGLLDEPDGLGEVLGGGHRIVDGVELTTDVDRDDVSAFLGEQFRVRPALSPRRPGNQRNLAFQRTHESSSYISMMS